MYFLEFPVCHQAKIHPSIFITTIFWFYGDMRNIEKKKKKKETEKKISWTIFNAKRLHWIWLKHWAKFQRWSVCFTLSRLPYPFLHKMLMSNRATWKSELWGIHKFGLVSSRLKKDYKLGATVLLMYGTALMVLYVILIHCTSDSEPCHYIWLPSQIIKT